MSFVKNQRLNYLLDTTNGGRFQQALLNCARLPYEPEIDLLTYKDLLLNRILLLIMFIQDGIENGMERLWDEEYVAKVSVAEFKSFPDEEAKEYTESVCRGVISLLKKDVILDLTIPLVQECLENFIYKRDEDFDSEQILEWVENNKYDLFKLVLSDLSLKENGDVFVKTTRFGDCSFAYQIYLMWKRQ